MNELTKLNNLFHQYDPTTDVASATKSTEAFANEVFDVTTNKSERFFIKILKKQNPEAIAKEVEMQGLLLVAGIRTPQYLQMKDGSYIGEYEGERFLISKYITGSSPKKVSDTLIESFGETLAKLHDALKDVVIPDNTMQWLNPNKVLSDIGPYQSEPKLEIQKLIDYGIKIFDENLPEAVIHGDLWLSNVFADNDHITTVFDLETAERTVRIIDIARTYTSIRFNSPEMGVEETAGKLLRGYDNGTSYKITEAERNNIYKAIAYVCGACATWHAVHGTRYRDPYIQFGNEAIAINGQ